MAALTASQFCILHSTFFISVSIPQSAFLIPHW